MQERKIIRDPGAFQLLADETRMKMIYLLRAKEMTVSQIATEVGLTPQTIYHHIKKLREADMVEVAREERIEHLVESYFRATAGYFYFIDGGCSGSTEHKDRAQSAMKALNNIGMETEINENQLSGILKHVEELKRHRDDPDILGRIFGMDDVDPSILEDLPELAMMMKMNDGEFEKYLETQRSMRKLLLSGKIKKPEKRKT